MTRRDTVFGVVLIAVGVLSAAAAGLLIFSEVRRGRAERAVEAALTRADARRAEGELEAAVEALEEGALFARTARQWLSLVKRAYRISEATGDYTRTASLAARGARTADNDLDLLSVAVHAALRAEDPAQALALMEDAPNTTRLDALRAEALLSAGTAPTERRGQFDVLAALSRRTPPKDFSQAFDRTADPRFAVNEALRLAEEGDTAGALGALEERDLVRVYPVVAAYLAYDLEDYERYEALLGEMAPERSVSPEHLTLQADIALLRGQEAEADALYAELREAVPGFSPVQYHNAAWLARERAEVAVELLARGAERFPAHTGIARAQVLAAVDGTAAVAADQDAARDLLRRRRTEVGRPVTLDVLEMHLWGRRIGPVSGVVARLWDLVNRYPQRTLPVRYLGWYLVSIGDWPELSVLVDRHGDAEDGLTGVYQGILAARDGDWTAARELFVTDTGGWESAYNAGLAAMALGVPREAHDHFDTALSRLSAGFSAGTGIVSGARPEGYDADRALILTADGLAYGLRGAYAEAFRRVSEAARLDPDSVRTRYLLTSFAARLE